MTLHTVSNDKSDYDRLIYFGRTGGKSTLFQQIKGLPNFDDVKIDNSTDYVTCIVGKDVQQWLEHEIGQQAGWAYIEYDSSAMKCILFDMKRVVMRGDLYSALVLKWS